MSTEPAAGDPRNGSSQTDRPAPAANGASLAAVLTGLLIGIVIGAMLVLPFANSLRHRNAWPRGLMTVMEQALDDAVARADAGGDGNGCDDPTLRARLLRLQDLGGDIGAAFTATADARFMQLEQDFLTSVNAALETGECRLLQERLQQVDRRCEACHQAYR